MQQINQGIIIFFFIVWNEHAIRIRFWNYNTDNLYKDKLSAKNIKKMNHVCFTTQITLTMIKLDNPNNINHDKSGSSCFTLSRFSPTDCYLSPFLHSNWLNDSVFKSCLANSSNKVKYVAKWNKTPVLIPSPGLLGFWWSGILKFC